MVHISLSVYSELMRSRTKSEPNTVSPYYNKQMMKKSNSDILKQRKTLHGIGKQTFLQETCGVTTNSEGYYTIIKAWNIKNYRFDDCIIEAPSLSLEEASQNSPSDILQSGNCMCNN